MMFEKIFNFIKLVYWKTKIGKLGAGSRIFGKQVFYNSQNMYIGEKTYIYNDCIFTIGATSKIIIGNNSHFGVRCYCNCSKGDLHIGNNVAIGPYTQIYTYSNDFLPGKIYSDNHIFSEVKIGNNVFIGAGVIILPGTVIEDNSVVAAGAVVKGNIERDTIVRGFPINKNYKIKISDLKK